MEAKKSEAANTEKLRLPLVLTGFLVVGSLVLASFSYSVKTLRHGGNDRGDKVADVEFQEEIVVETPPEETPPPPVVEAPEIPDDQEINVEENKDEEPEAIVDPGPIDFDLGEEDEPVVEAEIIDFPDVDATFPGGAAAMQLWISENVVYPQTAIEMEDQGRVYLSFVVEPNGDITNIEVIRSVTKELDKEAKRVVRAMPKWTPGEAGGKKVRTRCRLPIIFELN